MKESYIYQLRWRLHWDLIILSNSLIDVMHSWDSTGARVSCCTSTVKLEGHWRVFVDVVSFYGRKEIIQNLKPQVLCGWVSPAVILFYPDVWQTMIATTTPIPPKPYPLPTSSLGLFFTGTANYKLHTLYKPIGTCLHYMSLPVSYIIAARYFQHLAFPRHSKPLCASSSTLRHQENPSKYRSNALLRAVPPKK